MKIYLLRDEDNDYSDYIEATGADAFCIDLLNNKIKAPLFYLKDIRIEAANIIKQEALSVGGDVAIHRDVISGKKKFSDAVMICNRAQIMKMAVKLKAQPFSLSSMMESIIAILSSEPYWSVRGGNIMNKPFLIMGILNVTPDSFYDGGKYSGIDDILKHTGRMIEEGADIIDIGGQSTRPGSDEISVKEEMERVLPVLQSLRSKFPGICISVDTYRSETASAAGDAGADIINDISGFNFDKNMAETIASKGMSAVAMHIKGTPRNMQRNPEYENLMFEITDYLEDSLGKAQEAGMDIKSIAIDPGIGFGKTVDHNFEILSKIPVLKSLKRPVLIGASNKSYIGKYLGLEKEMRMTPTAVSNAAAYLNGARIFRVHNVRENFLALKTVEKIERCSVLH
ncbi:MAG: dihydropteroate synthase [candidate division WOR-3 bacterium]|nr:dihydropteroate synthase [candidate division WOR-3 bacterium]